MILIRVGIVGTGHMATIYGKLLRKQYGVKVQAVVDEDRERAIQMVRTTKGRPHTQIDDTISRIDIAYVFSGLNQRVEVIRKLAEAGKAIFCHHPLAATLEDGEAIARTVRENDVPFMMNFPQRFRDPIKLHLRDTLMDNLFGRLQQIYVVRLGAPTEAETAAVEEAGSGGLTLYSLGEDVDLIRWLTQAEKVEVVAGDRSSSDPERENFDDSAAAILRINDHIQCVLQASWNSHVEVHHIGVIGSEASAVMEGRKMRQLERLRHRDQDERNERVAAYTYDTTTEMGYEKASRAFIQALKEEKPVPVTVEDGLEALRVCHEIMTGRAPMHTWD